jgi:hypothetical protein
MEDNDEKEGTKWSLNPTYIIVLKGQTTLSNMFDL